MTVKINRKCAHRKKCIAFLHVSQQEAPQSACITGRKSGDSPSNYGLEQIFPMPIWTLGKGCSRRGQSVSGTGFPREAVMAPSLPEFKEPPDDTLSHMGQCQVVLRGAGTRTQGALWIPSKSRYCMSSHTFSVIKMLITY